MTRNNRWLVWLNFVAVFCITTATSHAEEHSLRSKSADRAQRGISLFSSQFSPFEREDAGLNVTSVTQPTPEFDPNEVVIRAQDLLAQNTLVVPNDPKAPYDERPKPAPTFGQPPVLMNPQPMTPQPGTMPGWPGIPMLDPWQNQEGAPGQFGAVGPQPYRYGWQLKFDVGNIFNSGTQFSGAGGVPLGDLSVFEFNGEMRYTAPLPNQWIWSLAPQFSYRGWSGPELFDLPADVYRTGLDVGLTTPAMGPYTIEFGFNPTIGTDFDRTPKSNALMWDGRGAVFIRTTPQWMWVLGAQYWDRVRDRVVPWAGFVLTPDDRWEIRAVFPNPQITAFLGTPWGTPAWMYLAAEYHVEAYDVSLTGFHDQMEIKDWRVMLGLRTEQNGVTSFIEGGWVFDRRARFRNAVDIDIDDGFMVRGGMRF